MRTLIFTLLCLLFWGGTASAQWTRIAQLGESVEDLYFLSPEIGFASTRKAETFSGGKIHRTTDGGYTWTVVMYDTMANNWTTEIGFFNDQVGIVAGRSTIFYRTTDGGLTWDTIPQPAVPVYFETLEIVSDSLAFAANWRGEVIRSTDQGQSWQISLPRSSTWYSVSRLVSTGPRTCLAACIDGIYRTEDAGDSWSLISQKNLLELDCRDELHCLGIENGSSPMVSNDGGITFFLMEGPRDDYFNFNSRMETSGMTCLLGSFDSNILISEDYGGSWKSVLEIPENEYLLSFSFLPGGRIIAAGSEGSIYEYQSGDQEDLLSFNSRPFPNPFSESLTLGLPVDVTEGTLSLFDARGQKVLSERFSNSASPQFDTSSLRPGLYVLKVEAKDAWGAAFEDTQRVVKLN